MLGLTCRPHISNPVRSVGILPWGLFLSQFLLIKSLKLFTMDELKTTSRTFFMVIIKLVAEI